ncbi:IS21 family transposase [Janthinobacterium sp.]|uniref:IS21 family transposase n=1 Tax=Janthinobacterium sp. TaxID=1871054 RepID=UPI00293D9EC2|nr:IS21 family transposase [Janthinobacterium sp.]
MAGKRIGDHQVGIYKKLRTKLGQEVAAAKAGISVRSARRLDSTDTLPSQRAARAWRTRADPFEAVWQSEVVPLLEATPALTATTLLEEMQRRHPGQYDNALLRTLQRRVRTWGASHGREREVFFAQAHPPGRLGLSDFTHAAVLQVSIAGAVLLHLLYQFALAYSGWRYVEVVLGGESFMALSSGLQNAVWMMGGVPEEHRTDSLTAAYNNQTEHELLTRRYEGLCLHYGMRPSRNNLGVSHENGSIESRQGTLKRTMEQALLLRGHRDFADLDAYRRFVAEVFGRLNARVAGKFNEERRTLKALPSRRSSDYEEVDARVTKYGTMTVKKVLYTAPSRLVGHRLKVRIYSEKLECWLGNVCVLELLRGQPDPVSGRGKVVDYRHLLPALKRKPGALARSVLRDALFPRTEYRLMWARLRDSLPEAGACRLMVGLLDLAGNGGCEAELAERLALLLAAGELPDLDQLRDEMAPRPALYPAVTVVLPELASYDLLLTAA